MLLGAKLVSVPESSGSWLQRNLRRGEKSSVEGLKKCRKKESTSGSLMRDHHHPETELEVDFEGERELGK